MDQADQQARSCNACVSICNRMDVSAMALQPGLVPRHAEPRRSQRLLAAATVAAALLVGLNALVQALNVLAAWWNYRH